MGFMIRELQETDRPQWEILWQGYQAFYKIALPEAVTNLTWARFFDDAEPVFCLMAAENGKLLGLVHYLFHRNTWMAGNVCYLQDLFTHADARGKGVGRALIEAVYEKARQENSPRVYWMTHETNTQAMILYDKAAEKSGFLQYRKQL